MSNWAKPGVKCVCVDDRPYMAAGWDGDEPKIGNVYTVSDVWMNSDGHTVVLEFRELKRAPIVSAAFRERCGYAVWRFRPLATNKTQAEDVALFKRLLDAPAGVEA